MTTTLSPAVSSVSPRGMKKVSPRLTAAISVPGGNGRPASGLPSSGEPGIEAVFEQPHRAAGELFGVDRAGDRDDPLDVLGELRLGPDDAVDAEQLEAVLRAGLLQEVLARDEADRLRRAELVGHAAGDDVDFVEAGAGDEDLGALGPGAGRARRPTSRCRRRTRRRASRRRSAAAAEMSMTVTSCRADSACARP